MHYSVSVMGQMHQLATYKPLDLYIGILYTTKVEANSLTSLSKLDPENSILHLYMCNCNALFRLRLLATVISF